MAENKEVWSEFDSYWKETDWENISRKRVKKILGDSISFKVPHHLSNQKIGEPFYTEVEKEIRPPQKDFGLICFKDIDVTFEQVFGKEPINRSCMLKTLWELIRLNNLSLKSKSSNSKVDEPEVVDTSNEETDTEETEKSVGE